MRSQQSCALPVCQQLHKMYMWQCEAYCEGVDGVLETVSFTN